MKNLSEILIMIASVALIIFGFVALAVSGEDYGLGDEPGFSIPTESGT